MTYEVEMKPRSLRDLRRVERRIAARILDALERLSEGLNGDVKRLTDFTPEYRLRVGDYRVLFEIEGSRIVVYRILHRRDVYR